MKKKRIQKPRVRVKRNTGTEVFEDSRTKRARTRAAQIEAELREAQEEIDQALRENYG